MAPYSSEDEEYSGSEEELSDEELAAALAVQREWAGRGGGAAPGPAGSDEEEEDAEGEEGGGGGGGGEPLRQAIYNVEALHDKLEDIAWSEEQPWEESLALTSTAPTAVANAEDDLERELAFYNQALEAAQTAVQRFEAAGLAWQRPADYYAEMVKSDEHMAKVKEQLLFEKQQIEAAEQRKQEREAKKFSKQVAAERKKERAQEKKAAISNISKLRKQREKVGFAGELDVDAELERLEGGGGGGGGRQPKGRPGEHFTPRDKSKKRQQRDSKFGFGGPKRLRKQNDAGSAADVDGYRPGRFDDGVARKVAKKFGGGKGGGGGGKGAGGPRGGVQKKGGKGGKGKQQRPGKARRAAMKAGK
ncbi:hypothetical protein ABPG75_007039 [Micractinium tetrahymenae]